MNKYLLVITTVFIVGIVLPVSVQAQAAWWGVRSIDTMKYSRDVARQYLQDPAFDRVIEQQISLISQTGATHVAIATPYDAEFLPFLSRWVTSARRHNLKVWFRGNWSGWEGWFGYPRILPEEHLQKTRAFILNHPDLFVAGDIFTPCPECENGGPGDPRLTGDVTGFRRFLIDEYHATQAAFATINKQVVSNYASANGDVARLVMDPDTTRELGGLVTIDHYVRDPQTLVSDIQKLTQSSGGRIVLGEFGAPVPDIHGTYSLQNQADWVGEALKQLTSVPEVEAVNYWTSFGGSTRLYEDDGSPRPVVAVLTSYFKPHQIVLSVTNSAGRPLKNALVVYFGRSFSADSQGIAYLPRPSSSAQAVISAPGYQDHGLLIGESDASFTVELTKTHENWLFKLHKLTYRILTGILQAIK